MKGGLKKYSFIMIVVCISFVFLLCFSSCSEQTISGTVSVRINDEDDYLIRESSATNGSYMPGTVLIFYSNPIMDGDLCMYVNDEYYASQTSINNGNGFIWQYTFTVPDYDIIIDFKIGSSAYRELNTIIDIPLEALANVVKIRFEQGYIGVAPGRLTDIEYSSNESDINNFIKILNMPIRNANEIESQICGGGYVRYSFFTENERYDIYISNSLVSDGDKSYIYKGNYPFIKYADITTNSFITYLDDFKAYNIKDKLIGEYDGLSQYEFIEYSGAEPLESEKIGYIQTEFGKLYIYSDNIFSIEDSPNIKYYSLVGEKNFNSIFTGE